jgi:hypothetical protein
LARETIVAAGSAWGADEPGKETTDGTLVEKVHGTTCSCTTHQHSSPAPQSAPPSAQHIPPTPISHLAISTTQNITKCVPPIPPPANMANPWFGSDVAARPALATLRAAVIQRPLLPSKMSATSNRRPPAHAQRISIHLQRLKARNTCPPDTHIMPYRNIKNLKHNKMRTTYPAAYEYGQSLVRQ